MYDIKKRIEELKDRFDNFVATIKLIDKRHRKEVLTTESLNPGLWDDQDKARAIMQELGDITAEIEEVDGLSSEIHTLVELAEIGEADESMAKDVERIENKLSKIELKAFLSGPYDKKHAIITIHAGQGGTEAMDWTSMLFRMYMRFCERKAWKFEVLDETPGEEAGLKSITCRVTGLYAYGYLKRENGTHRLVRQSPFNADKLRQTSFAMVEVLPEFDDIDLPDIEIRDDDLEIQFFRSSSQGGQNVQKVSTAVRIKHIPTGVVVSAQTERYQEQNRKNAMTMLRAKIWALEQEKLQAEKASLKGDYVSASWGTQIRSYVLHPYKMIKDLRTDAETGNTDAVLDGDIDLFIEAELQLA